jgi:H+/Cl- antiporter ClcA
VLQSVRSILLSALVGILAGTSATLFFQLLNWAADHRTSHPILIYFLPLAGLISGVVYHRFGQGSERGPNLILDEIHSPQGTVPARMVPLVVVGSTLSQLFGASAGREGAAVQISASLADQVSRFFAVPLHERKALLMAGAGAGFGAAIGAPIAGAIFGMEVILVSGIHWFGILECVLASFIGHFTSRLLGAPHMHLNVVSIPDFSGELLLTVIASGILFGVIARLFIQSTHAVESAYRRSKISPFLRPLLGGALVLAAFLLLGDTTRYAGLGLPVIQEALTTPVSWSDPFLKLALTALSVGSGFRGGEFVPLVFMGATLGSALSTVLPGPTPLLAALGFASAFGGAANTPFACTMMAMELFGPGIGAYALLTCLISHALSGNTGIYPGQRLNHAKFARTRSFFTRRVKAFRR